MNIITDPIVLAEKYPGKFKFVNKTYKDDNIYSFNTPVIKYGRYSEYILSFEEAKCIFLNDGICDAYINDSPNGYIIIQNKFSGEYVFTFLNIIGFSVDLKYAKILKNFKINNSSWVKVEMFDPGISHISGTFQFYTPLDMMAVCNELFINMHGVFAFITTSEIIYDRPYYISSKISEYI